eukprot:TRINITY_DN47271_c0_g1_i2.p2 TRINITY_DN47271_c0_g1~~TRINITY_DN47271_c0_g1_i2.p2  ORF type:complete len:218 (+),score=112.21 TRINITY_DN47271_c0_g1_i2:24-656(+)
MSSRGTFLENFLDSIKTLPNDFQRILLLIGEVDAKTQVLDVELRSAQEEVLKIANSRKGKQEVPVDKLKLVRSKQAELNSLLLEKEALAEQARVYIGSYRSRLERDLKEFEEQLGPDGVPPDPFAVQQSRRPSRRKSRDPSYYLKINPPPRDPLPSDDVYCYCRQVSHGEMVACDNANCEIEWFHFVCVGLRQKPKGKWYCDECRETMDL